MEVNLKDGVLTVDVNGYIHRANITRVEFFAWLEANGSLIVEVPDDACTCTTCCASVLGHCTAEVTAKMERLFQEDKD